MAKQGGGGKQVQPYGLAEEFERAVVYLACTEPRFMERTAHEMQPELLAKPEHQLALREAQALFRDGRAASAFRVIVQRCAKRREEGKATHEEVLAVASIPDAFDDAPPRIEEHERELVAVLRKRLRFAAAQAAIAEYGKDDWDTLDRLLLRERLLGVSGGGLGVKAEGAAVRETIAALVGKRRTPLGIDDLDNALGGGVPDGTLTCFMAGAGGAKSMTLSHITAHLACKQKLVVYATLELPVAYILARLMANVTGITIHEVEAGKADEDFAQRSREYELTPPYVQAFTPGIATVASLKEWVGEVELKEGRRVDAVVVDYADKLAATGKDDGYLAMRDVFETYRIWMEETGKLGITATQSKGRDDRKSKKLDIEHTADSAHKGRIVDHYLTLNYDDVTTELMIFLAKNRFGEGRKTVGPLPTNFACGQVAPVGRAKPPTVRKGEWKEQLL